jgi:hypothetical protein
MGLDLRLILPWPEADAKAGVGWYATEIMACNTLYLERDSDLFAAISTLEQPLPAGFRVLDWDDDTGFVKNPATKYGDPWTYAEAGPLAALMGEYDLKYHTMTRAAAAYLRELDPTARIVLDWR